MRIYPDQTQDEEFKTLGGAGYTGSLNDRQFTYLSTLYTGSSLADLMGLFSGFDQTGLSLTPDYYIDATEGNDSNDGSEGSPWATLTKINDLAPLSAGETVTVRIRADTYDTVDDFIEWTDGGDGATLNLVFESGCVMDGTVVNASVTKNGFEFSCTPDGESYTTNIYGNGLTVQNYVDAAGTSPNGVGNRDTHILYAYDVNVDTCEDGFSAHGDSQMYLYDCTASNCTKGNLLCVDDSVTVATRCTFSNSAGICGTQTQGAGISMTLNDCVIEPNTSGETWNLTGVTMNNCWFGTLTHAVTVGTTTGAVINDSFVNCYIDGNRGATFYRCFGKFSARTRPGETLNVRRCIFVAPATGQSSIVFSNFNAGSASDWEFSNNIFETSSAAAFMSVDANNAGYLVAADAEFFNNVLSGSAAYDADLIAADSGGTVIVDTVTGDALIGAANSYNPDDYAYAAGSPAIGAATDGGNCGFGIGEVSPRSGYVVVATPQALSTTSLVTSVAEQDYDTGDVAWTNPENITAEDSNFASCSVGSSGETKLLLATVGAGTFSVPSNARIDGVTVTYSAEIADGSTGAFAEAQAYLVVDDSITGLDLYDESNEPPLLSPTTYTKGGSASTWGVPLTPTAVNSAGFGVALRFNRVSASTRTVRLYWVKIQIHYTTQLGEATPAMAMCQALLPSDNDSTITTHRFAFPGMGTPAACLVFASPAPNPQPANGAGPIYEMARGQMTLGVGTSPTSRYVALSETADGVATSGGALRSASTTHVADNHASNQADINAIGDGYIDLDFSAVNIPFYVQVVAIFADNAHLVTQSGLDGTTNETSTINAGFEPDLVIAMSGLEVHDSGTHDQYMGFNMGFGVNNGSGFDMVHALVEQKYKQNAVALANLENLSRVGNDLIHYNVNSGDGPTDEESSWTIDTPTATGYRIVSAGDDMRGEDGAAFLALSFNSATVEAGIVDTPTSTGESTVGSASITPDFMLNVWTMADTNNSLEKDTTKGDLFAVQSIGPNQAATVAYTNQNAQSTVNAESYVDTSGWTLRAGDQTDAVEGDVDGLVSGGFQADLTTADATARKGIYLAIK